ncbi:MAG: hypothetical protein D6732_29480 [Methanobacteriota archaeon]|nr:MAG: hypothetical protein D6732_29480 [Euryarchaeota archaeon]
MSVRRIRQALSSYQKGKCEEKGSKFACVYGNGIVDHFIFDPEKFAEQNGHSGKMVDCFVFVERNNARMSCHIVELKSGTLKIKDIEAKFEDSGNIFSQIRGHIGVLNEIRLYLIHQCKNSTTIKRFNRMKFAFMGNQYRVILSKNEYSLN